MGIAFGLFAIVLAIYSTDVIQSSDEASRRTAVGGMLLCFAFLAASVVLLK